MRDPLAGADILTEAHNLITGARQNAYGHPKDDYAKVLRIFQSLTGIRLAYSDAIFFMVSVKLARLVTNLEAGKFHRDSIVDAAGYLGVMAMIDAALQAPAAEDRSTPETPA